MPQNLQEAYHELITRTKECSVLESCKHLIDWDEQTYMPRGGSQHRAEQIALLAKLHHKMFTASEVGDLLGALENSELTADPQSVTAVNIREIRRMYARATKIPETLVKELAHTTTLAGQRWRDARIANDFPQFQPWLEKIIHLKRQEAAAIGYSEVAYDALLDEYEPGATTAEVTAIFAQLRKDLVPFIAAIQESKKRPNTAILSRSYPIERQSLFSQEAAAAIGFDFLNGRLDTTTHPFCSGIGPGDCRITTRYDVNQFNMAFFGVMHEAGHGIYDQGLPAEHYGTPRGQFISLGIHESQSRMWENQVGRSRAFWEHFFPRAQQVFPTCLSDVSLDDFYFAINDVQPSFIRVEADEATYNMHIILRFELEQALIHGDLQAADVPTAWNEKFNNFFGMTPPSDAMGCLQDIHWSMGGLGYFPTYTLGNLYAAQFMDSAREKLVDLDEDFRQGKFYRLREWLNVNIHGHGQTFRSGELCQKITGKPLSPDPLIKYLKEKFTPLYGL